MAGGGPINGARAATPRGELTRIRESRERQDAEVAERIRDAMLDVCGERGFRQASVQNAIDRYGGNRVQFYRHFGSKAECYESAYATAIDDLCNRLLGAAAAQPSWRLGLRAALRDLSDTVSERPHWARGLLVEAHVAGGANLARRSAALDRLAAAIDSARLVADTSHSPPSLTATFMVGAIESAAMRALSDGRPCDLAEAVPDLARMVVAAYFGEAAGDEELAALQAA